MLNPLNFLSKFIKSSNQKELDRISKIVEKVNSYESTVKGIADEEFPKKFDMINKEIISNVDYVVKTLNDSKEIFESRIIKMTSDGNKIIIR